MTGQQEYSFDPTEPDLWSMTSNVDWIPGAWVAGLDEVGALAEANPWIVRNRRYALSRAAKERDTVLGIIGALMSWRVCTVRQLQAGLAQNGAPDFDRDSQNLYGALIRLGVINVGTSVTERRLLRRIDEIWLSIGNDTKLIRQFLKDIDEPAWLSQIIAHGTLSSMRQHARHNTFATHAGIMLGNDPRVKFTGGDGFGAFRAVDRQALDDSGMSTRKSMDIMVAGTNNTLTGIEVQAGGSQLEYKLVSWINFLQHSPMNRRGILCVWLFLPYLKTGYYPPFHALFERMRGNDSLLVGNPDIGTRMGWALWSDWFDRTETAPALGEYTDMFGTRRSIFDPAWKRFSPNTASLDNVRNWGWARIRRNVYGTFGWDCGGCTFPERYRGGFYGFYEGTTGKGTPDDEE